MIDYDNSALDAVHLAHHKANEIGKPYCIVSAPSGGLLAVPEDQCRVDALETVYPTHFKTEE